MKLHYTPEPEERNEHIIRGIMAVMLALGLIFFAAPHIGKAIDQEFGIYKKEVLKCTK